MWFKDNIIYCSDGSKTIELDLNSFSVDPYDPTKDTAMLPYDNKSVIGYKDQTIANALYEQLGEIIQNKNDIAEIKLELPSLEYDPLVDTAMLPYNNNGVAADKEQTIYQSLVNILNTALSSVGFYDPTKNTATLPYIANNSSGVPTLYEKNQTVSDSLKNVMNRLIELIVSGGTTYDPTINMNRLPYIMNNELGVPIVEVKSQTVAESLDNVMERLCDEIEDKFDPKKTQALLPYNNNGVAANNNGVAADKQQTVYDSLLDILNTALKGGGGNTYDPTKDTANLPYINENSILDYKEQTISDSIGLLITTLILYFKFGEKLELNKNLKIGSKTIIGIAGA